MAGSLEALKSEYYRLTTYRTWPEWAKADAGALASTGLYYMGIQDKVRCIFCDGMIANWEDGDVPHMEHAKHFRMCPFIRGEDVGNIPIDHSISSLAPLRGNLPSEEPRHSRYLSEKERMKTFQCFSSAEPFPVMRVEDLVRAGFFYSGSGDGVLCFHCDVDLRAWEEGDDAFVEHARWSPHCPFIKQIKGEEFIHQTLARFPTKLSERIENGPGCSGSTVNKELDVDHIMESAKVAAVLEMDYSPDIVRRVVETQIKTKGTDFANSEELMESVMAFTEDDKTDRSPKASTSCQDTESNECIKEKDVFAAKEMEQEQKAELTSFKFNFPARNTGTRNSSPDSLLCKICLENEIEVSFIPCGHFATCSDCSKMVKECPMCRARIRGTLRTYLS